MAAVGSVQSTSTFGANIYVLDQGGITGITHNGIMEIGGVSDPKSTPKHLPEVAGSPG